MDVPLASGAWPLGGAVETLEGERKGEAGWLFSGLPPAGLQIFRGYILLPKTTVPAVRHSCNFFCLFGPKDGKGFPYC